MLKTNCFAGHGKVTWTAIVLLFTLWPLAECLAQWGGRVHTNTLANNSKSNQSRVWFYQGSGWTIVPYAPSGTDYIWRYDPAADIWIRTAAKLDSGAFNRYDVILDAQAGDLAVLRSHYSATTFYRFAYSAGVWTRALTKTLSNFGNADNSNPCSLLIARNGQIWVFRIANGKLQTRKSNNGGANWSAIITLKTGLHATKGTTAAVCFSQGAGAENCVGVAYGEVGMGGVNTVYGFLYHRDSDPPNVWMDESDLLALPGGEKGNNQLSLVADPQQHLYLFTRNFGGTGNASRNTLYKRLNPGVWKRYVVNTVNDFNWNSPAVAIDTSNGLVIVAGIRSDNNLAEYKCAPLGMEPALALAPHPLLVARENNAFQHLSMPHQFINQKDGLLVTAGNVTEDHTWFNYIFKTSTPVTVGTVELSSHEVNARSNYTIPVRLTDPLAGTLPANFAKIFVRFSPTTLVPETLNPQHVKINGVSTTLVTTQPQIQRLTITTPIDLPGDAIVFIEIDSASGILNAQHAGDDSVRVWTSAQLKIAPSPNYALVPATTQVSAAWVSPDSSDAGLATNYAIGFRLGAHGRMVAAQDTFFLNLPAQSTVGEGALTHVLVNNRNASAYGNNAAHLITIIVPAGSPLANRDSVTIFLPAPAVSNPTASGNYTLSLSTSVERAKTSSRPYAIGKIDGKPITGTLAMAWRSNQSKVFYDHGAWWLAGLTSDPNDNNWYLWKFDGTNWNKSVLLHEIARVRPDLLLDPGSGKLYALLPGASITKLSRLTYAAGGWSVDAGYPKPVNSIENEEINLVRAKNGNLWVFWIADSTLYAQRSNNEGNTWFSPIIVKRGLKTKKGLTDAVAFNVNGENAIGLGYAEDEAPGATAYGFLYHTDADPGNVWTDETNQLILPPGAAANNHLHMITYNKQVFMIVKSSGGVNIVKNALYVRRTNNNWARFDIIQDGNAWMHPVLALDASHKVLYAFGTVQADTQVVEMKRVPLGQFSDFLTAPREIALGLGNQDFFAITMPSHEVTAQMNLMVVAENETQNTLWYRLLTLPALAKSGPEEPAELPQSLHAPAANGAPVVEVYPNPFNPSTQFHFTLSSNAPVKLQIFNINGQLVRTLEDREILAGTYHRIWRGTNEEGAAVASGTYFYRLQIGSLVKSGKLYMIK